jgi:hypothetical protein
MIGLTLIIGDSGICGNNSTAEAPIRTLRHTVFVVRQTHQPPAEISYTSNRRSLLCGSVNQRLTRGWLLPE